MNWKDIFQTGIFTAILTACVTLATCIISKVQEYKVMKIKNFDKICDSLIECTEKRFEIVDKCNTLVEELANILPDKARNMQDNEWESLYRITYDGINKLLGEYSKCLELLLLFSYCLYKNKLVYPIIIEECWSILKLYESIVRIDNAKNYKIEYVQIITLVQFIKVNGNRKNRKQLCKYLTRNEILNAL